MKRLERVCLGRRGEGEALRGKQLDEVVVRASRVTPGRIKFQYNDRFPFADLNGHIQNACVSKRTIYIW